MYEDPEQQYMKEWSYNMSVGLSPLLSFTTNTNNTTNTKPRHGVFSAACYIHGDFTHAYPLLNDMNFYTAFRNFYNNVDESEYKLSDTCGVMCNPTCPVL